MVIKSRFGVGDKVFYINERRSNGFDDVLFGEVSNIIINAESKNDELSIRYDISGTVSLRGVYGDASTMANKDADELFPTEKEANYYQVAKFLDSIENMLDASNEEQRGMVLVGLDDITDREWKK